MRAVILCTLLALVTYCLAAPASEDDKKKAAKKFVIKLNGKNNGEWKAKLNKKFAQMTEEQRKMMAGGNGGDKKDRVAPEPEESEEDEAALAKSAEINEQRRRKRQATCTDNTAFDVRTKWPDCAAFVNQIQNQAVCGSCWAVSSASAFTDRYCIERSKKGIKTDANDPKFRFSAADIMSCAPGNGCNGGGTYNAWRWINSTGITSGTDYPAHSGCKPYPFDPDAMVLNTAPACASQCSNSGWNPGYSTDRKFVSSVGILGGPGHIAEVENEIRNNGPVVASMDIYEGIYHYGDGVYKHVEQKIQGSHAVKLVGWGTRSCTDGTSQDYWLVANSWGAGWGQKGFFQIAKGSNECGIEQKSIVWGSPVV